MERITLRVRTKKKEGTVPLMFRLRDTNGVDIYYKSDIAADVKQLDKFETDGSPKKKVTTVDKSLVQDIKDRKELIRQAYVAMKKQGLDITSEVLQVEVEKRVNPIVDLRTENPSLINRYKKYAEDALRDGIIGAARQKHINIVGAKLERFLIINGLSEITPEEFTSDTLMEFRNFIYDEYLYVEKHKRLYKGIKPHNLPTERTSTNTVVSQLKMLQTFFNVLDDADEIRKSPFRKLGAERRKAVMKTQYDDPIFLRAEELEMVRKAKVAPSMEDARDAFVVQCAFGCRVGDFQGFSMDKVAVSDDGIPYIHYIPHKTAKEQTSNTEIQTPIVRYAFDLIKKYNFVFPCLRNINGTMGYNAKIRGILQGCGIDRKVAHYDESQKENVYLPLYKAGSSKLARKTHVDMMNKVQIDKYAAGLHKAGSGAVNRYTNLELKDRFDLMNLAFGQKPYKVDTELNIIGE